MILFFTRQHHTLYAVETQQALHDTDIQKLNWLFGDATLLKGEIATSEVDFCFIGPRAAMVTPWSTNAVEITQNMDIPGIVRIEEFKISKTSDTFDPMLFQKYDTQLCEVCNFAFFHIQFHPQNVRPSLMVIPSLL